MASSRSAWWTLLVLLAGCKNGPITTENLFGNRTTVPPPGTGTASTTPPYDPFASTIPQTAPAATPPAVGTAPPTSGNFTPPAPPTGTPPPAGSLPPGGTVPPAGYAPPGGSYQTSPSAAVDPRNRYAYRYGDVAAAGTPPSQLAPVAGATAIASRGASPDDQVHFAQHTEPASAQPGGQVDVASGEAPANSGQWRVPAEGAGPSTDEAGGDSSASYAHDPQYRWLQGRLDYSEDKQRWRIRYRPVEEPDDWGGALWIADTQALEGFQAGDFVAVQGSLVDVGAPDPEYQVDRIRPLEP